MLYFFAAHIFFRFVFNFMYKSTVTGVKNLPKTGAIIAPNHVSYWDGPYLAQTTTRSMHFLGKKPLFENLLFGLLLHGLHTTPIEKGEGRYKALNYAKSLLKKNKIVVIFPEGGRCRKGKLKELKRGVADLSIESNCPIIPTWISGMYECWPAEHKYPKFFGRLSCHYGTPINPGKYSHLPRKQAVREILKELEDWYIEKSQTS